MPSFSPQLDICGETEFIEQAYTDWNTTAIENQIAIIPACGYDSVPADIGCMYAKLQFQKKEAICTQSEMFVTFGSGTSRLLWGASKIGNVYELELNSIWIYWYLFFGSFNFTIVPLPASDVPVVKLGQQIIKAHIDRYKYDDEPFSNTNYKPPQLRPVYFAGYIAEKSWLAILYLSYIGVLLSITSKFIWFRNLVIKYPGCFTLGVFTKKGPTEQQLKEGSTKIIFF